MMPVVRDAFSQQAADTTQWADTIDWTVRCDWLQVASSRTILYCATEGCKTCASVAGLQLLASFIAVVIAALNFRRSAAAGRSPRTSLIINGFCQPGV